VFHVSPVGSEDPPARQAQPADPTGFDLKQSVAKLEHDTVSI
jgi:hypothetical protein